MQIGSLFSGIGGFDLAARWMGWSTKWYSEIDPYACRVMERHFGKEDVADPNNDEPDEQKGPDGQTNERPTSGRAKLRVGGRGQPYNVGDITQWQPRPNDTVDVVCGGFPCQPVSLAGQRKAQDDERWLWPEFARVLGVLRPRYVVIENVPGLRSRGMVDVLRDLAQIGYDAEWTSLSAADVGAPHRRERVWIVAYPNEGDGGTSRTGQDQTQPTRLFISPSESHPQILAYPRCERDDGRRGERRGQEEAGPCDRAPRSGEHPINVADPQIQSNSGSRLHGGCGEYQQPAGQPRGSGMGENWTPANWRIEPNVGRVAHGVPARVDRLKCLGNAIVPQCAYEIFRCIQERTDEI